VQTALEKSELKKADRILIVPPLPYHELLYALDAADVVATDSGGIQEEGSSLGKKILVLRNETDRPECLDEGLAVLVSCDEKRILAEIEKVLQSSSRALFEGASCYGDGKASERIVHLIKERLKHEKVHGGVVDTHSVSSGPERR